MVRLGGSTYFVTIGPHRLERVPLPVLVGGLWVPPGTSKGNVSNFLVVGEVRGTQYASDPY